MFSLPDDKKYVFCCGTIEQLWEYIYIRNLVPRL